MVTAKINMELLKTINPDHYKCNLTSTLKSLLIIFGIRYYFNISYMKVGLSQYWMDSLYQSFDQFVYNFAIVVLIGTNP